MPTTTLVSWNLKGSASPDLAAIVDHLRAENADVVALQEVQRRQARAIAHALGARSWRWGFKHWPVRTWPEGMAIIGVTGHADVRTLALSQRWRLWSWRRRIVQVATVAGTDEGSDAGASATTSDDALSLINVHLTPHGEAGLREIETTTVLALVAERTGPVVVCGDLNERPGGAIHRQMAEAGLRDGWAERSTRATEPSPTTATATADEPATGTTTAPSSAAPSTTTASSSAAPSSTAAPTRTEPDPEPGTGSTAAPTPATGGTASKVDPWPTNWRGWRPGTTKLPTQQLDYVYASAVIPSLTVRAPVPGAAGFERFATLSDHLPITADIDLA